MRQLAVAIITIIVALNSPQSARVLPVKSTANSKPAKFTLLYTSSAFGQIRSCNCTKFRFGGYGRQLTALKAIRKDTPDTVLVEGGDCVQWTGFQGGLKLDVTKKALHLLDYDLMVPGEDEMGRNGHRLIDKFDPKEVPIICANLLAEPDGKLAYPPYRVIKTTGGLRVGVLGLLDPDVGRLYQEKYLAQLITDPAEALKQQIGKLRKECDVAVLIYHGPLKDAEELASIKGVDLILATHRTSRNVVFPAKGENVAKAQTKTVKGVVVVNAETKTTWSLGRIDVQIGKDKKIATAKHELIYLDRRYDEDPAMVAVYDSYNGLVKDAVLAQSSDFKSKAEALLTKRGLNLAKMRERLNKSPFATDQTCKSCHSDIHESWAKTRHATAMSTLEKSKQEYDPECVTCHATGVMVRNGFENMRDTPKLANVQCESCHGEGLAHTKKPEKGYGKVSEQTCRSCHTDERTPEFDYATACAKIKH